MSDGTSRRAAIVAILRCVRQSRSPAHRCGTQAIVDIEALHQ
jgi:hypothetical protein